MMQEFQRLGIPTDGVFLDSDRPSTLKTRVIAHSQQVVRIDHEESEPLEEGLIDRLCAFLDAHGDEVQGIIISDYAKGVVTQRLMEAVRRWSDDGGRIVAVDPKINRFSLYRDVTVVTPNHKEAAQGAGMEIRSSEDLLEAGARLIELLQCKILLVTRGEEGMTLFERGGGHLHIPTIAREVYDVTGAGDTVISAFTLGLCAGASPQEAALLANLAAGIVVGEVGTATVSRQRLLRILSGID
jgi:D-beta-D-heptose 7-phosphate kinase/D-beta-D-heptose 1-phosphate adenosyltransferase